MNNKIDRRHKLTGLGGGFRVERYRGEEIRQDEPYFAQLRHPSASMALSTPMPRTR